MSFLESIRLALMALRAHKLRSALTALGVMIGVLTVIAMMALIDGLNNLVSNQLSSIGSNTLYVQKFSWTMNREEFLQSRGRKNLTLHDSRAVETRVSQVSRVAPLMISAASAKFGGNLIEAVQVVGTTPEYQFIINFGIEDGRPMADVDLRGSRPVAMIGATIVSKLYPGGNPVGTTILLGPHHFRVIASLTPRGSLFGNDQDNMVIIPLNTFMKYFSGPVSERGGETMTIAVQPSPGADVEQVKEEVRMLLRQRRKVPAGEPDDFNINTADQIMRTYRTITAGVFGLMIGATVLSLVVGGIGIMNIMLVSVSERIREIGIRKAVGARRKDIRAQFLIEAVTLSTVGGIVGMIFGFLAAWAASRATNLPAAVTPLSVLLGFGFSALVGIFFGWYPANRAASLKPIEALRYE